MQSKNIILQQTTPEEIAKLISDNVKIQLDDFKKNLNIQKTDEILNRKQACEFLGVNVSTITAWSNKGTIPVYGLSGRRYYKKSELLECLKPLKK